MNKTKLSLLALLAAAAMLNIGCVSSVRSAYNKTKTKLTSKEDSSTTALYAQVPDKDKENVAELKHELEVTKERKVLADLEEDRDNLMQDRSEYNVERLQYLSQEKVYRVQLAKLEAIDRNKLGDKVTNLESITDVHINALKVQQKRLKMDSKVAIIDLDIEKVNKEVEAQELKIKQLQKSD